jgi:hypothetical protein
MAVRVRFGLPATTSEVLVIGKGSIEVDPFDSVVDDQGVLAGPKSWVGDEEGPDAEDLDPED